MLSKTNLAALERGRGGPDGGTEVLVGQEVLAGEEMLAERKS